MSDQQTVDYLPHEVVAATLRELGWPDDRDAPVRGWPLGCYWDMAADVARVARAPLVDALVQAQAELRECRARLDAANGELLAAGHRGAELDALHAVPPAGAHPRRRRTLREFLRDRRGGA